MTPTQHARELDERHAGAPRRAFWKRAALYLGLWTFLAALTGSQQFLAQRASGNAGAWSTQVLYTLTAWHTWGVLTLFILALGRRFPISRESWRRSLLVHVPACFTFSILDMLVCYPAGRALGIVHSSSFPEYMLAAIGFDILLYAGTVGVGHAIDYHRKYRDRELRASRLQTQLSQTQLQILRMQIHPHFLFNTLHAISALMHKDVAAAEKMLIGLSDLLRMTIHTNGAHETPLRREMELLSCYLDIMKTRFGERLGVSVEIEPAALDAYVPAMLLQPLVENAIEHGIGARPEGGRVALSARIESGMLAIEVHDDGPGLSEPLEIAMRSGMGLSNTRDRLAQLYGAAHRFEARSGNGGACGGANGAPAGGAAGFTVRIVTPFRSRPLVDGVRAE
ncbi:MAG: sensor histidine kinase [bacterium]